jgi:hypothetical protein
MERIQGWASWWSLASAPLSDKTTNTVLSNSPLRFKCTTRRPTWWSMASAMAAQTAIWRLANLSFGALGPAQSGVLAMVTIAVRLGTRPSAMARSRRAKRKAVQPSC